MDRPSATGPDASDPPRAGGLGHTLRATLSQTWDYIFLVMGGSLLWAASVAVPATASAFVAGTRLAIPVYYLLGALTVGPSWVALYGMSAAMARREMPAFGDFLRALRRFYWRGVALFLVQAFVLGGCVLAAWFYQAKFHHWALMAVSLLWVYVGLFWIMMGLYAPAFLVRDDGSVWAALRKAAILTLAYPGYTFLILLQIAILLGLILLPIVARLGAAIGVSFILFFFLLPAFVSLLATNALHDLLAAQPEPEGNGEEPTKGDGG